MKRIASTLALSALLTGCALFTSPIEYPVYEQHAQDRVNTFSIIPSRRMVIMKSSDPKDEKEKDLLICAEASADVSDNLMSSLAASLSVAGPTAPTGQKGAEAAIAASKALETTAQFLFKRTQGIQLYRDGMYHLCQARMNKFIDDVEYRRRTQDLLDKVLPLINTEIPLLWKGSPSQAAAGGSPSGGSPEVGATAGRATASTSRGRAEARIEAAEPGAPETTENGGETPPPNPPSLQP
jgi:hypothetical protein